MAFLNQFNLGRYWPIIGPQVTLYTPSSFFETSSDNYLTLLEFEKAPCENPSTCVVQFVDIPNINGTTPG